MYRYHGNYEKELKKWEKDHKKYLGEFGVLLLSNANCQTLMRFCV